MAVPVEQQVFRLEITVDDIPRVQVLERQRDFGGVKLSNGVREALDTQTINQQPNPKWPHTTPATNRNI